MVGAVARPLFGAAVVGLSCHHEWPLVADHSLFVGLSHVLLPYKGVLACLKLKSLPDIGWQEGR